MDHIQLLQTFAIDKEGHIRSVDEVNRGLACECLCPACGEPVIARQGEVREWHFAHTTGTDCSGAAESALHLAAKQVLVEAKGIMLPEIVIGFSMVGDRGPVTGTAQRPATWVDFLDVETERTLGQIRPDVYAVLGSSVLLIEIAVTHFIDESKNELIRTLELPCIEIDLSKVVRSTWTWDQLRETVVDGLEQKQWVWELDRSSLINQAIADAQRQSAEITPKAKPRRRRYYINGHIVDLITLPYGVAIWSPYSPTINELIKDLARRGGGHYKRQFRNWVFPAEAEAWIAEQLEVAAANTPPLHKHC